MTPKKKAKPAAKAYPPRGKAAKAATLKKSGRTDAEIDALVLGFSAQGQSLRQIEASLRALDVDVTRRGVESRLARAKREETTGGPTVAAKATISATSGHLQGTDRLLTDLESAERRVLELERLASAAAAANDSAEYVRLSKEARAAREELRDLRPPPPPDPNADPARLAARERVVGRFRRLVAQAEREAGLG